MRASAIYRTYWGALAGFRSRAAEAVVLRAVEGVLEGSALVILIPVLNLGLPSAMGSQAGWLGRFIGGPRAEFGEVLRISLVAFTVLGLLSAGVQLLANRAFIRL